MNDFGFRGCTSVEQSIIGGSAHLLTFTGSATMSASYYVQFHLTNSQKPRGSSLPGTEHSVMTAWSSEAEAIKNELELFGEGVCACVMDSYDYSVALGKVLPGVISEIKRKNGKPPGGLLVLRPDSGDPGLKNNFIYLNFS